jgi:hypothetical protein
MTILNMIKPTIILTKNPDTIKDKRNKNKNIHPGKVSFTFIFLLGVISAKWWIDHSNKRIRIYLPESKRYLAEALKEEYGGTLSNIRRDRHRGVMWQTTSTRSLKEIKEAARLVRTWLPPEFYTQLSMFLAEHI